MRTVVIMSSSRSEGHTKAIAEHIAVGIGTDLIDLAGFTIAPYDYEYKNQSDDFLPLMKNLAAAYDLMIWVTPVYWFTMSSGWKIFLDRWADLTRVNKEVGRSLEGKYIAVVSCGSDEKLDLKFASPFEQSATYMNMKFLGHLHTWIATGEIPLPVRRRLDGYIELLKNFCFILSERKTLLPGS